MSLKVYHYENCGTCQKARKWLDEQGFEYKLVPIREKPPTKKDLRAAAKQLGGTKKLFNSSGQEYRRLNLKEKLPEMGEKERIDLLAQNGALVKRPLVVGDSVALVGFKEDEWEAALKG